MVRLSPGGRIAQQVGLRPSVKEVSIKKEYETKIKAQKKIAQVNEEINKFNQNITYENYKSKYNALSSSAQKLVEAPSIIFGSTGYKEYQTYKSKQAYASAYGNVLKHYNKGMLWAVAGYGEGLEQEIAKKMIKEGYSSAKGGLIEQETYQARKKVLEDIHRSDILGVKIVGSTIVDIGGKPITIQKAQQLRLQQELVKIEKIKPVTTDYFKKGIIAPSFVASMQKPSGFISGPVQLGYSQEHFKHTGELVQTPSSALFMIPSKVPLKQQKVIDKLKTKDYVYSDGRTYFYQNGKLTSTKGKVGKLDIKFYERVLGTDPTLTPKKEFQMGKEFSLRYGLSYIGKRGGDWWKSTLEKEGRGSTLLSKPAPSWAWGIISELPTWLAFSPYMKTGSQQVLEAQTQAQESKWVYDYTKQKYVLKSSSKITKTDFKNYLEKPISRPGGVTFVDTKSGSFALKSKRLMDLLKVTKTSEQRMAILKIARTSYGDAFIKRFATQQGAVSQAVITTPTQTIGGVITTPPIPTMEHVGVVGALVTGISKQWQPSAVGETQWLTKDIMPRAFTIPRHVTPFQKKKVKQTSKTASALAILQQSASAQDVLQQSASAQDVLQQSKTMQDVLQQTKTMQDTMQRSLLSQMQPYATRYATPKSTSFGVFVRPTIPKAKPKFPIVPFMWPSWSSVMEKKKKQQGYIPQAKSKGKWKNLSKKPMSRNAALGRMSRTMDHTLSAQGRIKKSGGKISVSKDNYFSKVRHKLRPYKIRKGVPIKMHNRFIEKRAFRVDTIGEKKGLRVSKMVKNMGWMLPTKKRRKKSGKTKKKSNKSN